MWNCLCNDPCSDCQPPPVRSKSVALLTADGVFFVAESVRIQVTRNSPTTWLRLGRARPLRLQSCFQSFELLRHGARGVAEVGCRGGGDL
jgi:hypothetical protein